MMATRDPIPMPETGDRLIDQSNHAWAVMSADSSAPLPGQRIMVLLLAPLGTLPGPQPAATSNQARGSVPRGQ
jgi:hypothetical protein